MGQFFGSTVTHTLQKIWGVAPGLFIWTFHWVTVIHIHFLQKSYDYVKHFVRILVLLVINTGYLKKFLKYGEYYVNCWFPVQSMLNAIQADLCSTFFSNFSGTPCIFGFTSGFPSSDEWGPLSRWWEILFAFVFLEFTSTCGEQPFVQSYKK